MHRIIRNQEAIKFRGDLMLASFAIAPGKGAIAEWHVNKRGSLDEVLEVIYLWIQSRSASNLVLHSGYHVEVPCCDP